MGVCQWLVRIGSKCTPGARRTRDTACHTGCLAGKRSKEAHLLRRPKWCPRRRANRARARVLAGELPRRTRPAPCVDAPAQASRKRRGATQGVPFSRALTTSARQRVQGCRTDLRWDVVCSPKMQWWSLLALADLYVINSPNTSAVARIYPHALF